MVTKSIKAHDQNFGLARQIVYTYHFTGPGIDFKEPVPILSALIVSREFVRARVKFWLGTDQAKSSRTTKFIRAEPSFLLREPVLSEPYQKFSAV